MQRVAGRSGRGVRDRGRRFSVRNLQILTFAFQRVPRRRLLATRSRSRLMFLKVVTVVSPPERRSGTTMRRYVGTNVHPIVVAKSRGVATTTVTGQVNVLGSLSRTYRNTRVRGVDSRRLQKFIPGVSICTEISPRRGVQVIHT